MTAKTGIGASVPRKEDFRFLTGRGRFTDDIRLTNEAHAFVLRAPYPHALIGAIDTSAAEAGTDVLAVLTAETIADDVPNPIPAHTRTPPFDYRGLDGAYAHDASQYPLARGRVRYLGEPVAMVVAETLSAAEAAAEAITVDYEPLDAIVTVDQALAAEALPIWPEHGSNVCIDWAGGDEAAVDAAFAAADRVVSRDITNNRVAPAFMEPRAAIAEYAADSESWTLQLGCQSAHGMQAGIAHVLGIAPERLRVIVPDMGGGFGARGVLYPEFPLLLVAARRLGRPVRWTAARGEAFLTDTHARDHVMRGELALDSRGRFTGLRFRTIWRHGPYLPPRSLWVILHFLPPTVGGPYRLPAAWINIKTVFTNTTPQAAYRGVGRAEANYLLECLIDAAAGEIGLDPLELRRRNMVAAADLPWAMAGGGVLTSGQFADNLERALELADWAGFPERRREAAALGLLRGIGVAMYVENDGSSPTEYAEVEAGADGKVTVRVGTQDFGMSHDTVFTQIASDTLGLPFEDIEVVFGDTDKVSRGLGSHGSRTARMGGGAVIHGARRMVEAGKESAGELLEAAPGDIHYEAGRYRIAGTDMSVGLYEVAAKIQERGDRLRGEMDFNTAGDVFANGAHVAEVAIDRDTGRVRLERHIMVADVGRAINPMVVDGQLHGGAAQGIGQALLEQVVYDSENGQTLSGSFMDYALPRADDMPAFVTELNEVNEADNPLGVKGVGENATTGAPAAVMNAIHDALRQVGGGSVDMPATSEQVWRALNDKY